MNVSDMSVFMQREYLVDGLPHHDSYGFVDGIENVNGVNVHWYSATDPSYYASGGKKLTNVVDTTGFTAGHEYEMVFYTGSNYSMPPAGISYHLRIRIDGNLVYDELILPTDKIAKTSFHFTMPDVVSTETRVNIEMEVPEKFAIGSTGSFVGKVKYYVSEDIIFTDLTENPSWLGKILQRFSDLGDSIRNLGTTIGNFFTNLGESIGGFFKDLWTNIKQKFDDLKQWFNELGDRISGFFDDLKLKIETTFRNAIDEIKSWFIPSDGFLEKYNDKWLNWCDEHFGVLVQFPEILVDLIHRLNDVMSPNSYVFAFPEISVPIAGRTYVFVEEQTVDMSFWLNGQTTTKYLYNVYTVCVYAIFIFALFKYIQHIDEKIMSKG